MSELVEQQSRNTHERDGHKNDEDHLHRPTMHVEKRTREVQVGDVCYVMSTQVDGFMTPATRDMMWNVNNNSGAL